MTRIAKRNQAKPQHALRDQALHDQALQDQDYMHRAIAQASKALGRTRPNPAVGAVIVRDGRLLGQGYHHGAGQAHAEVEAIKNATRQGHADLLAGSTMYVTLEPCNHQGRTGPCTQQILAAGISRVVVGRLDPNPIVSGRGIRFLRRHGIKVSLGVEAQRCDELICGYHKHINTALPWIIAKAAISLDGRLATRSGDSRGLSGSAAQVHLHQLRASCDAIVVGIGTVLKDDPQLNVRFGARAAQASKNLIRVVVDSQARTPVKSQLVQAAGSCVIAHCKTASEKNLQRLQKAGVELIQCRSKGGQVSLADLFRQLGRRGLMRVLVEGGGELHGSLLRASLADELLLYVTPHLIGGDGVPLFAGRGMALVKDGYLAEGQWRPLGEDMLFQVKTGFSL